MTLTRREALRRCLIISIGATIIPACMQEKDKALMPLRNIELDAEQQTLVAELSETIIPKTDTPGSRDTYTHLFVLKMLDDCTGKEEQQQFVKGLKEFDKMAEKKFDKPFVKLLPQQRAEIVTGITGDKAASEDVSAFYKTMKKLTVQGYMTSQYYLTNVRVYKLVPGKFYGCLPVTSLKEKGPSI